MEVIEEKVFVSFSPDNDTSIRLIIESLLRHFFSSFRRNYYHKDALWFMRLANEQEQWTLQEQSEHKAELDLESCMKVCKSWLYCCHTAHINLFTAIWK